MQPGIMSVTNGIFALVPHGTRRRVPLRLDPRHDGEMQVCELFRLLRPEFGQLRQRFFAFSAEMHAFAFGPEEDEQ